MVKINLTKSMLVKIVIVSVLVLAIFGLIVIYNQYLRPIKSWDYKGVSLAFRADLRKADKIPVYPNETEVYGNIMSTVVENVTIAFKDAGRSENPYYILQEVEIINKVTLAYIYLFDAWLPGGGFDQNKIPKFKAVEIDSYDNLSASAKNPIIALVHPIYANETAVRNEGHVTYISGKTYEEFDLATVKFLMIVLGIEL